ncbi:MAG TPA: hypothetical protein VGQ44_11810 [Gemmatimonadaceae bacterium]|jgi:hypothetical protein|nr:hypothetical protein [Gemmatimonadaceae bacterium]
MTAYAQTPDPVESITRSVLYEGYILWPYRRSALKNQRRWTFGGVYPRAYSRSGHDDDPWLMRTECLIAAEPHAVVELDVSIRFLHVVERRVLRHDISGDRFVDSITVGGVTHVSWQEATERVVAPPVIRLGDGPAHTPIEIDAGERSEPIVDADESLAGTIVRRWQPLSGAVDVSADRVSEGTWRVRVDVSNRSAWAGESRELTLLRTMASTHARLSVHGGAFVSLTDPPDPFAELAAGCKNLGTWPVLVGDPRRRDTVLSSPIILPDFPSVAPESRGDFFDGAEIDQLLVLNVMSLTDEEQRQMRETDPRAREILDRCRGMSPDQLLRLHGVTRERSFAESRP